MRGIPQTEFVVRNVYNAGAAEAVKARVPLINIRVSVESRPVPKLNKLFEYSISLNALRFIRFRQLRVKAAEVVVVGQSEGRCYI